MAGRHIECRIFGVARYGQQLERLGAAIGIVSGGCGRVGTYIVEIFKAVDCCSLLAIEGGEEVRRDEVGCRRANIGGTIDDVGVECNRGGSSRGILCLFADDDAQCNLKTLSGVWSEQSVKLRESNLAIDGIQMLGIYLSAIDGNNYPCTVASNGELHVGNARREV